MKMNRRQLGKSLAGTVAATLMGTTDDLKASVVPVLQHRVTASNGWEEVLPGIWKATLGQPEDITVISERLVPPKRDALKRMAQPKQPPIPPPTGTVTDRGTTVDLPLAAQEELYGFGLQFFSLKNRGKKRVMRVNADPHQDTGESHAPVPFYVTNHGYGILIDTARYATFYCGEARDKPEKTMAAVSSGDVATSTETLYSKVLEPSQSSRVLVEVPSASGVDVYLFAGPTMLEAVRRYNLFSGGGVVPPKWGLGFWYRVSGNLRQEAVTPLMKEFRARRIPCDVMGLEPGWQQHSYSCSFTWSQDRFPDPTTLIKEIKALDLHINLWEHAFTHPSSPLFPSLVKLSGDKGVWGGLVPDFGDPGTRQVFGDYHGKTFVDLGIDGFKLDECDNSDYTGCWSFPELSRFPSGADGEQMHSLFGLRYQAALWAQFKQRNRPTYSLVRSSGALAAPYPFVLYSDLYDHRQFVRALVNSGFSGLLWCPEVRDARSEEDLLRRLQTVVFSPLAMINGWYIANPPWKQMDRKKNNANDLARGWETLEAKCREIIGWRMQIVPYLQSAFERYAADGTPPFRALTLDWPDTPGLSGIDDAWMVGDRMLVAPLFADEAVRTLVLPPGDWHNFWTGARLVGGKELQILATETKIPVFVKTGSIMPLAPITNSVADPFSRQLSVKIYGDGSLPFELTENGAPLLSVHWKDGTVEVEANPVGGYSVADWSMAVS
ncbi:TIM-barrel domain-containing protein [Granulicella arctica]|uniref:Alpha-D-xyloside xylohydrolase n=1 Tax=Granulicella arctica TaxID=940613 RepID=A0A7Y9PH38_9BACT|nr:glycoside hydrolase family 31 protein [Granulicella arctica]NYF79023.1 alpha-D-xyloside xylohydrolase [Granulicella arctica]